MGAVNFSKMRKLVLDFVQCFACMYILCWALAWCALLCLSFRRKETDLVCSTKNRVCT